MAAKKSKPIGKVDDAAKQLIIEVLGGAITGGFDIDSIYCIKDHYYVIEFLKCETVRPFASHPNRYWFKNKQKFISLWNVTQRLKGTLYLVNYEDSREQFMLIEVHQITASGIPKETKTKMTFDEFKAWFKDINTRAINQ